MYQSDDVINRCSTVSAFENVAGYYEVKRYDRCLYFALQLLNEYPKNAYLISRIGKVLLDLCVAKEGSGFESLVSSYTVNYGQELRWINNFLNNLTPTEMKELTFHFLSSDRNFVEGDPRHYYLLWKISELSYKWDVKTKVQNDFKKKFGMSIGSFEFK